MAKSRIKLTDRQAIFVKEYLIDLSATQAAIRAGYSKKTAYSIGQRLLKNVEVQEAARAALILRAERTGITAERVIREIAHMGLIDVTEFAGIKEPEDLKSLPEPVRRSLVGWSWSRDGKFQPKTSKEKAVEMLARHLGLLDIGDQQKPAEELNSAIEELDREESASVSSSSSEAKKTEPHSIPEEFDADE